MEWLYPALDILTAIGTVGATVVALWLALRESLSRINGVFIWSAATNDKPTLLVQNIGNRIAVIEVVQVFYDRTQVCNIDFSKEYSLTDYAIIETDQVVKIPIDPKWLNFKPAKKPDKKRPLKVVIKPRNGRRCVSKQKYSYNELNGLFFGCYLLSD